MPRLFTEWLLLISLFTPIVPTFSFHFYQIHSKSNPTTDLIFIFNFNPEKKEKKFFVFLFTHLNCYSIIIVFEKSRFTCFNLCAPPPLFYTLFESIVLQYYMCLVRTFPILLYVANLNTNSNCNEIQRITKQ